MITINLLPTSLSTQIEYSKKNKRILLYLYTLIALCLLLVGSFIIAYIYLKNSNDFFLDKISKGQEVVKSYTKTLDEARDLEGRVSDIQKIKKSYLYWSKFNEAIDRLTPAGVYLFSIDTDGDSVKVAGYAKTKEDIAKFQKALEGYKGFAVVNIDSIKEVNDPLNRDQVVQNFLILMKAKKEALQ